MRCHLCIFFLLFSSLQAFAHLRGAQKNCQSLPIVLLHGVNATSLSMEPLEHKLQNLCPNLLVYNIEIGRGRKDSFKNLWDQVEMFKDEIVKKPQLNDGFHLIAHSQGGVIARAYVEMFHEEESTHRVQKLITLGSPHRGVDGIPEVNNTAPIIRKIDENLWRLAYQKYLQGHISLAELWNDPIHHQKYLDKDIFLPVINNEVVHPLMDQFRQNIISLSKLILFKSTREDVVKPIESCWFDYYKDGSYEMQSYNTTDAYKNDQLGLRSLNTRGDLKQIEVSCVHVEYPRDQKVFQLLVDFLEL